jgi:RimJ/RimL family protein N-acetyltransferase
MGDPGHYHLRRLTPADAPGVRELALCAVAPGYRHPEVFEPEELLRLNREGRLVSVVALDDTQQVVGHYALERPNLEPIAETGEAMVLPAHRGRGLMERMAQWLHESARAIGLVGLNGRPVTHHVASQRCYERCGSQPTGLCLGDTPASTHRVPDGFNQRLSHLLYFKYLVPPSPTTIDLPARHRDLVERIYHCLGKPVVFGPPRKPAGAGRLRTVREPALQRGTIQVLHVSEDSLQQIRQAVSELQSDMRPEAIYLELPLTQAGTAALSTAAEDDGFFFAGIQPGAGAEDDTLVLQRLSVPLDMQLVQVAGSFARDIAAHVADERRRIK